MDSPVAQLMMPTTAWSMTNWLAVFIMWAVMMAAMMLPSAAPMILWFAVLNRRRSEGAKTLLFVAAYLALWAAFSGAAVAAQWLLQSIGYLSPMIVSKSCVLNGALLLIAGVFQLSPLKHVCLRACRSPLGFLTSDWRDGLWGACNMGIRHGLYCLGCCWALMALLFVGGVMNLLWIAALAGLVAIEKLAPKGEVVARALGGLMIGVSVAKLTWVSPF
jgi:predicted metal-binding membrane protein